MAFVGLLTLWPLPDQAALSAQTPFLCLPCGADGVADLLLNLVLFVPLGLALASAGLDLRRSLVSAFLVTMTVEVLQATVIIGRDASFADIASNTLGGGLGALAGVTWRRWVFVSPRVAATLTVGWATLVVAIVGLTTWSLRPSLPTADWYSQWTPFDPEPGWFSGTILEVELGRRSVPHWRIPDHETRRVELADSVRMAALVVSITPPSTSMLIVAMARSGERFIRMSQHQQDLGFTVRTRAADLRLRSPEFVARHSLPAEAGDTILVEALYTAGAGILDGRRFEVSPLDGWSLLVSPAVGGGYAVAFAVTWLFVLFVPVGWYGGQVPSSAWAAAPVFLLLAQAILESRLTGVPLPTAWQVAVGALASLAGRVAYAALEGIRQPREEPLEGNNHPAPGA